MIIKDEENEQNVEKIINKYIDKGKNYIFYLRSIFIFF